MRSILILAAFAPIVVVAAERQDTTFNVNGKQIVVADSAGQTRVTVYGKNGEQLNKTYETAYVDGQEIERVYVTSPFIPQSKKTRGRKATAHFPALFLGFNMIPGNVMGMGGNANMHTRDSKSWEWGFTAADIAMRVGYSFALTAGWQWGNVHNHFQDNYVLTTVEGKSYMRQEEGESLRKSYISYNYIRFPVMMEWQSRAAGQDIAVGIGVSVEFRVKDRSRYFIGKEKYTETKDINMNPVGANIEMLVNVGAFQLYGRAAITPLLKRNSAPTCYPVSIGAGIGF